MSSAVPQHVLSLQVLDGSGASVSNRPSLSRLCATDINGEMPIAAGATDEETMAWAGLVWKDGQRRPLAAGTYGIRSLLGVVDDKMHLSHYHPW